MLTRQTSKAKRGILGTVIFLFLLLPKISSAQYLFHSSITQTWPSIFTTDYQQIDRSILLEENAIVISTQKEKTKEFETYFIEEMSNDGNYLIYSCRSGRGERVRLIFPIKEEIRFIDFYTRSSRTGEEVQIRFHVR